MTHAEAEDRIRHRIAAGMTDRETFTVIIAKDEAKALLREVHRKVNSNYLDALRKGSNGRMAEAALQNKDRLDMLAKFREHMEREDYNPMLRELETEAEFGMPVRVAE